MVWRVIEAAAALKSLIRVSVLLLGGLELVLRSGVFTEFDFHKVDLLLVWCKLVWMADPGPGYAGWD
jgi:hypothetical protein